MIVNNPNTYSMKNAEIMNRMVEKLIAEYKPEKTILFEPYAWGEPDRDIIGPAARADFTPALGAILKNL